MTDPAHITAWQRHDRDLTTSGFLTAEDVPALAAIGTRAVINLALDDHPHSLAGEAALLAAHGIVYHPIPVPFDAPGEPHFAAFRAALAALPRPVHVHCIFNWRVSAFLYRYNRAVHGMAEDEARARMAVQWDPAGHDHPAAPAWARFIAA